MENMTETRKKKLLELVEKHGLTSTALMVKKPVRQINDMLAGRKSFGDKVARQMEFEGELPPYYFDGIEGLKTMEPIKSAPNPIIDIDQSDFVAITRVDFKISAGIKGYAIEQLNGKRAPIFFRKDWMERNGYDANALHAISVSGESMETSLYDGDLVVINTADTKPVDGQVFAANYEGEVVIKRLIREAGQWWLSSDNTDKRRYPNKLADESTFIIGKVIHKQSERI